MPESIAPAFVRIDYHSSFGVHTMTIPTLPWIETSPGVGNFETWAGPDIAAVTMVDDLVDLLVPFFPNTVEWDGFTVFTQASPTDDPLPRQQAALTQVGSAGTPGWTKAVQITITARTTLFGLAKIVLLDAASNNNFDAGRAIPGGTPLEDFFLEWGADDKGWSGRDGGQVNVFIQTSVTLNEGLRKGYRMN